MSRNPQQTRQRLLEAAFEQMHAHGFQGMRVDEVLRHADLQKGAFYHHFRSKTELGYAVLEEQIRPLLESIWVAPLQQMQNPLRELPEMLATLAERIPPPMREHGCPLNNLAQEMAAQDAGFQERIARIFDNWIQAMANIIEQSQEQGFVRTDVSANEVARFVVASLEGCLSLFKAERSPLQWQACQSQLTVYLQGLAVH
ncbi:MAG: TetR/AcrR family transcriptional regulator [Candidatus Thiodiazotropha taylori]